MSELEEFEFRRRAEMERRHNTPVPPTGIPEFGPSQAGEDVRGIGSALLDVGKKGALPMAGSIAVPAAATAMLGPANVPLIPIEQGVGSGLGEVANQALGITEPSWKQILISTAAPIATGYGMNLLRTGKALPKTLNAEGPNMALAQTKGYRGAIPASQVMDDATNQGIAIPLTKTTTALQEMRNMVAKSGTPADMRAFEKVLKDTGIDDLATTPSGVTPSKMQGLLSAIGELKAGAEKIELKYLGKFFSSLSDDLDDAGAALGPARQYWKREKVLDDIEGELRKVFTPKGQGLDTQFNANRLINELRDTSEGLGKWFSQSFTVAERGELMNMLGFLNTLPSLKPTTGQWGSGRFWENVGKSVSGGGIGGGIGFAVGGPAGAAIGSGIGMTTPAAIDFARLALQAWKMPGGRQVVKQLMMNTDGATLPRAVASLTAFLSGTTAKSPKPVQSGSMLMPFGNEQ